LKPGPGVSNDVWRSSILEGVAPGSDVYFVHSYIVEADKEEHVLAITEYAGTRFASVLAAENVYGCQFHPEKSGAAGLRIIQNFVLRT
jgi:glutamine amidotransferase